MIAVETDKMKKCLGLVFLNSKTPTLVKNFTIGNEKIKSIIIVVVRYLKKFPNVNLNTQMVVIKKSPSK